MFYPIPNHACGLQAEVDLPETTRRPGCLRCPCTHRCRRGPRPYRDRRQHPGEGGCLMGSLRAGLVGIGMMGRNHARVLSSIDGVDFAVADPAGDKHGVAGEACRGHRRRNDRGGHRPGVVADPTCFTCEAGLELAEAGVHTLIEKPLAADTAESPRWSRRSKAGPGQASRPH